MINIEFVKKGISSNGFQAGDVIPVKITFDDIMTGKEVSLSFSKLPEGCSGSVLQSEIVDYTGKKHCKKTLIKNDTVFWAYIQLSDMIESGKYGCSVCINEIENIDFEIEVEKKYRDASNIHDMNSFARIIWFQSDLMQNCDFIPKPFSRIKKAAKDSFSFLGRKISLDSVGLPKSIVSYFNKRVEITEKETELLKAPFSFYVGQEKLADFVATEQNINDSFVCVKSKCEKDNYTINTTGHLEFDGMYSFTLEFEAKKDLTFSDISILIFLKTSPYFMGLGIKGGKMPEKHIFKWDKSVNQDGFWAGDVNGGLKLRFRDKEYIKPNVNIYYPYKPIELPESWYNNGNGTISIENNNMRISTGDISIKKGQKMYFGFDMWITPFKSIDYKTHFYDRYYQTRHCISQRHWLDEAEKNGANIINIHHGSDINPYINYPFYETEALKSFADKMHCLGCRVKIYNTIREISTKIKEFPIVRSLGYEIIECAADINGPSLWQEDAKEWIANEIGTDVIPAWKEEIPSGKYKGETDASILTNGSSRLCNYYIEGLNYLRKYIGIDGIYIDDTAYDRITMKRVYKIFSNSDDSRIDMHSWNHFDKRAGYTSSAYLYMELMPYISRLWLGESFDAEKASPEYWLVEMSGIPYGVTSDMLNNDGNFYRGLLFGETTRLGWNSEPDKDKAPRNIWPLFDSFEIEKSNIWGWWDEACPIKTDNENVLVTCYEKEDKILIAIANWTDKMQSVHLVWNRSADSISKLYAPEIIPEQKYCLLSFDDALSIDGARGLVLVLEK